MSKNYPANITMKDIEENGRTQRVVIAMTEKEAQDRSYKEYLEQSVTEKTREELKKQPEIKPRNPKKVDNLRQAMKEMQEYKERKQKHENTKRFY